MKLFSKFFLIVGLSAGGVLSAGDFWTSVIGLQALLPQEAPNTLMHVLPWVLAALTLSMNACASTMLQKLQQRQHESSNPNEGLELFFLLFVLGTCVLFDVGSSWVGFVTMITQVPDVMEAVKVASSTQLVASTIIAFMSCLGPYIVTLFATELRSENGFLGQIV